MAYLGNDLQVAFPTYRNIDDISGSFNGVTTSFPLTVDGVAPIPAPVNSQQCLISVNGVVQRPDDSGAEGFLLSGGNIVFASAPAGGVDFFGVILAGADYINIGANFPSGTALVPSITFDSDLDTGIYNPAGNQIGFTTAGVQRLVINSSGQVSGGLGSATTPAFSFLTDPNTGIYSPGADQVAVATNGTGRLFVDASGNVGIGSSGSGTQNALTFIEGSGACPLEIDATAGSGGYLALSNSGSAKAFFGFGSNIGTASVNDIAIRSQSGALAFQTGGVNERLRITSAGLVGIGASSPTAKLESYFSSTNPSLSSNTGAGLSVYGTSTVRLNFGNYPASPYSSWVQSSDGIGNAWPIALNPLGGNVGIGTTSPVRSLHVSAIAATTYGIARVSGNSRSGQLEFATDSTVNCGLYGTSSNDLIFYTSAAETERARINSSGRLLVGTSTSRAVTAGTSGNWEPRLQVTKTGIDAANIAAYSFSTYAVDLGGGLGIGPDIVLARSNSDTEGTQTAIANNMLLGRITFNGSDGTAFQSGAFIAAASDGQTWASGDCPTRLVFSTTSDSASSPTERMRITRDGYLKQSPTGSYLNATGLFNEFNANNANSYVVITSCINASPASEYIQDFRFSAATPNNTSARFWNCMDATAERAYMASNGGLYNYSANNSNLSDRNAKKDITPAADTWDCIKEWEIVNYRYKDQPDDADLNLGVIAQQVAESCPEVIAVFQEAKEATEDQPAQEERLGVKEQQMYWMAIKALQEAQVRIEALEARLTAAGIE